MLLILLGLFEPHTCTDTVDEYNLLVKNVSDVFNCCVCAQTFFVVL